jgi:hypothetical protein
MQVGIITVDGRQIGIVTQAAYTPDLTMPALSGGDMPMSAMRGDLGGDVGDGGHHGASRRHSPEYHGESHHDGGHHDRTHHEGAHVRDHSKRLREGPVTLGRGDDPRGLEGYIRSEAASHGVDPDTAVRVAKSEGLRDFSGDRGTSFGAFQLHKHGGLGDEFQKETGIDPADPANEKATISWALKNAKRTGWEPYHGAARVGVGQREGIDGTTRSSPQANVPKALTGDGVSAFIMHHTGGRGTPEGVKNTLRERGLGVQYIMDREGNITQAGGAGSSHMMTGWGKGAGLSNRNTVGMEVIARDNNDVTPAQVKSAKAFIAKNYPSTPVYGHGEVNPGHKEVDEGMAIVNAIRSERAKPRAEAKPFDPETMAP